MVTDHFLRPVEATVVLLPVYEFLSSNPSFPTILLEDLVSPLDSTTIPLFSTIVSLDSYLLSHALSTSSPRSIAYAGLSLNILLALVENNVVMEFITQTSCPSIHLCRQVSLIVVFNQKFDSVPSSGFRYYQPHVEPPSPRFALFWIAVLSGFDTIFTNG